MKVKTLKSGLEKLLNLLHNFEAGRMTGDLQKLIALMDGHEELSVDAFCKKARHGLEVGLEVGLEERSPGGSREPSQAKVRGKKSSDLRRDVVDSYVSVLQKASASDADFSKALKDLSGDKAVRLKELKVIAGEFMGVSPLSSKKNDLIEEIKTKRAQDLRTAHKFKILSQW